MKVLKNMDKRNPVTIYQNGQNLRGKAVVVVLDSAGVGLETAVQLAGYGAPVFLAARNIAELKRALAATNQAGGEGDGLVADLNRPDECRRFFLLAEAWLGRIDAVIYPLSYGEWPVAQSLDVHLRDLKSANIKSAGRASALASQNLSMQEAIQRMQAHGYGHIININLAGYQRSENLPEQRASAALRHRARKVGIRVTVIEPELVRHGEKGGKPTHPVQPNETAVQIGMSAQDVARCVIDSLAQPFGMDMVVLSGNPEMQPAL